MSTLDKSIAIPDFSLVVLIGATGSGKSTFAAKHFLPSEVISSDHCRALISDSETDQSVTGDAFDLVRDDRRQAAQEPEAGRHRRHQCPPGGSQGLDRIGAPNGTPCPSHIVFEPGIDICIERNRARPDRAFGAQVVQRMASELRRGLRRPSARRFSPSLEATERRSRRGGDRDAPAVVDRQTRRCRAVSTSSAIFMAAPTNCSRCSPGLATRSHGATTAVSVPSP